MIDTSKLSNITVQGIDHKDRPDYSDAFIAYAEDEFGDPLSDEDLDALSNDTDFVHSCLMKQLY